MLSLHIIVRGRVQGVNFRSNAVHEARTLGVNGFVKNSDRDVEIEVEGDDTAVHKFLDWCKAGPAGARVMDVVVGEQKARNYKEFVI
ncbi:MAG: acylphosphatase, partial [Candidatus Aenigmatarchaeota archaeon]